MSRAPKTPESHAKALTRLLEGVQRQEGWHANTVMDKFIESGFRAVHGRFLHHDLAVWQANEDAYLQVVASCRYPQDTMSAFAKALGVMTVALGAECRDFIGPAFMEYCANTHLGQFFTPVDLCRVMAMMQLSDAPTMLKSKRFLAIAEPACGVGAMVLAAAETLIGQGVDIAQRAHFICTDIDLRAARSCFLQCEMAGLSATVIHGDTLRLLEWDVWHTTMARVYPKDFRLNQFQLRTRPLHPVSNLQAAE